jgi:hypothetical protein
MSSSRTGTTGERVDARGMGIGVEECGQRAGRYVSIFARAACTVQQLSGGNLTCVRRQVLQCNRAAPLDLPTSICRDPTDIPVLGTALAGGASVLVTVDKDLLALGEFQGIAIIKPGEFWRQTTG